MSIREAGNVSFQASSPHTHHPTHSCQAPSPLYFAAAGRRGQLCPKGMGGNQRERALQESLVEPGRSRGLRNGEHDPLQLTWCYTQVVYTLSSIDHTIAPKHFCCIISWNPVMQTFYSQEKTAILEFIKSDSIFYK